MAAVGGERVTGPVARDGLLIALARVVGQRLSRQRRVLVGIDGPDGAGKTNLADALAAMLGPVAVRASIDGFHHPRERRLQRGSLSPEGYYLDSFDYECLAADLLTPFRDGTSTVRTRTYDFRTESTTDEAAVTVPEVAVLVFDGVFMLRPETRSFWDISIYLHVSPEETLRRVMVRDEALFGSVANVTERYEGRYLPGQALYREGSDPMSRATIVVDNDDPSRPTILRWGNGGPTPA